MVFGKRLRHWPLRSRSHWELKPANQYRKGAYSTSGDQSFKIPFD